MNVDDILEKIIMDDETESDPYTVNGVVASAFSTINGHDASGRPTNTGEWAEFKVNLCKWLIGLKGDHASKGDGEQ